MTRLLNSPSGWRAFRLFRDDPAPEFVRQHGNQKHGRYSKQAIADRRMMRLRVRMLRAGREQIPVPELTQHVAPGWELYRAMRSYRSGLPSGPETARPGFGSTVTS
jgi:hypothetical protein